jgi:hypothetical protein
MPLFLYILAEIEDCPLDAVGNWPVSRTISRATAVADALREPEILAPK